MISEAEYNAVMSALKEPSFRKGRWEDVIAEIQDEGAFLFIMIEARDYYPNHVPQEIKSEVGNLVATNLEEQSGSRFKWSISFFCRGKQYDVLYPDEL